MSCCRTGPWNLSSAFGLIQESSQSCDLQKGCLVTVFAQDDSGKRQVGEVSSLQAIFARRA
ncbi:hypothetical protein DY000_02004151 [Brassica cretica]|uniref:Telomeric single stranded DNA binding POT1/Cdc13 domain-containing protein n=1 Tax=Brassica cretica TaxID=69181 RepID=A0ABQ7BZH8_BRACR|nr:hypothetical protein DY000_02004151 [Brassica cretica]